MRNRNRLVLGVAACGAGLGISCHALAQDLVLSDTAWSAAQGEVVLSEDVVVAGGATLTIGPGVVVRSGPGVSIIIGDEELGGGTLEILGEAEAPVDLSGDAWGGVTMTAWADGASIAHARVEGAAGGGGVRVLGGAAEITGSAFVGNTAHGAGGALRVEDARVVVRDTVFEGNVSGVAGGAIGLVGDAEVIVAGGEFVSNEARDAGAISAPTGSRVEVVEALFEGNDGEIFGGAALAADGSVFTRCVFVANQSGMAGGAVANSGEGDGAAFVDCVFVGNRCAGVGGALAGPGRIEGGVIEGNAADAGGGIAGPFGDARLVIAGTVVRRNSAFDGGGVYIGGPGLRFEASALARRTTSIAGNRALGAFGRGAEVFVDAPVAAGDIDARGVWFGRGRAQRLSALVWDHADDETRARLIFDRD